MTKRFLLSSLNQRYQPLIYLILSLLFLFIIYYYSGASPGIYRVFYVFPTENSQFQEYINNISPFFHFGPEKYAFFFPESLSYCIFRLYNFKEFLWLTYFITILTKSIFFRPFGLLLFPFFFSLFLSEPLFII